MLDNKFIEFNILLNCLSGEEFKLSKKDFYARFDLIKSISPKSYFIVVIEDSITKEIVNLIFLKKTFSLYIVLMVNILGLFRIFKKVN